MEKTNKFLDAIFIKVAAKHKVKLEEVKDIHDFIQLQTTNLIKDLGENGIDKIQLPYLGSLELRRNRIKYLEEYREKIRKAKELKLKLNDTTEFDTEGEEVEEG